MLPHTNRQWDGVLQQRRRYRPVRTLGSVTTGSYSKGQTISYQGLSPVKEALTVSDSVYFAFQVDDIDKVQNDHDALMLYAPACRGRDQQRGRKIKSCLRTPRAWQPTRSRTADHPSRSRAPRRARRFTTTSSWPRGPTSSQNVPPNQPRWVVVNPGHGGLLLKDTVTSSVRPILATRWPRWARWTVCRPRPGFLGMCAGFEVYESTRSPRTRGKYLVYGDDMAIAYVAQLGGRADSPARHVRVGIRGLRFTATSRCSPKPPSVSATSTPRDMNALTAHQTGPAFASVFLSYSGARNMSLPAIFDHELGSISATTFQERYDSVDFGRRRGDRHELRFPTRSAVG